jgi:serine/threonine protein kinase
MQVIASLELGKEYWRMDLEKFGRYEVKSELGQGGMASVYHAYDPIFERDVAIKVLPSVFLHDPQFRKRFDREAKTIASLEHPAIVPVYDFGEENELPYIVMRYMAGGSLADRMKQGALPLDETIKIIGRLAPALDAAHARGIIHRDIKPGNILFDQYGNAFLSDFGIARITQQSGATLTGDTIVGTPTYMSPEQIHGNKAIDGRSDIYSLGVLTFQMLTGQAPYTADTPAKLMMMHVMEAIPSAQQMRADLDPGCDQVIAKAMAKDPDDRFSTAEEFATSLAQVNLEPGQQSYLSKQTLDTGSQAATITNQDQAIPTRIAATRIAGVSAGAELDLPVGKPKKSLLRPVLIAVFVILIGLGIIGGGLIFSRMLRTPSPVLVVAKTPTTTFNSENIASVQATATTILAGSDTATSEPTLTAIFYTPTLTPTIGVTATPTTTIIGGADKVAFLNENDLWISNLDGSKLVRLTEDGTTKSNLQWTPDGQYINYITGKCIQTINIESGKIDTITCFNFVNFFRSFEISPDGKKVAVSLDNQLYIVPNDPTQFVNVKIRSDLTKMADCKDLAPLENHFVKIVRWSKDANELAAVVIGVGTGGNRSDLIRVFDVSKCTPTPDILDQFPSNSRFVIRDFDKYPEIQNFAWDGTSLFALTSAFRNGGYGDLYIYNMELHKGQPSINPIDGTCCYRDPQWSPDGNYLIFAYQDYKMGAKAITQFYLPQYGTLGTGIKYSPMSLPDILDPRTSPQPILRPASP